MVRPRSVEAVVSRRHGPWGRQYLIKYKDSDTSEWISPEEFETLYLEDKLRENDAKEAADRKRSAPVKRSSSPAQKNEAFHGHAQSAPKRSWGGRPASPPRKRDCPSEKAMPRRRNDEERTTKELVLENRAAQSWSKGRHAPCSSHTRSSLDCSSTSNTARATSSDGGSSSGSFGPGRTSFASSGGMPPIPSRFDFRPSGASSRGIPPIPCRFDFPR